jgi:hypothetical protein
MSGDTTDDPDSSVNRYTFGFHPLGVWCDNTTELLAGQLRPGNAGANTAADHIEVLGAAIDQIPARHRKRLLIRADGAGASHALLDWGGATRRLPPTPPPDSWRSWRPLTGAHARVEDRIRHAKDTGLGRFPSREYRINQAWLTATAIAADLVAWLRLLALAGDLAEPKALRYQLLHVPARLTHSARRRSLRIPASWPWADDIVAVFARIAAIPLPA